MHADTPNSRRARQFAIAAARATILGLVVLMLSPARALTISPKECVEPAVDSVYTSLIREYTTDERFLSPLVRTMPREPKVPSPLEFLGYIPGAPKKLTRAKVVNAYMEALAAATMNVRLFPMGKSNEGREMVAVFIADPRVLDDLGRYASYTRKLADPRVTNEAEANAVIAEAKPFYYITGGLHSTETGSPEMLMELAYRLAVGKSELIEKIRKHVITIITPILEMDGRERMVDWYYRYTIDATDWDDMPPRTPPYWGKYVFHDNNRDGIQMSQPLTRHVAKLFFEYHPQVMLDLHESIPLLYVSSGTGPYNVNLDPIITSEWQWISNHEVTELTKFGMPGIWTWGFYTGWYPGYLLWFANNHNSIGRFYETFGNSGATTFERELKEKYADREITSREWYRPWPPEKKIKWSHRNNTNYMESGVLVSLDFAAENGKTLLYNFWKKGANAVERGKNIPPHAWVIPLANRGKYELAYLIHNLMMQGIEVHRLEEDVKMKDKTYAKETFVVRMDQPYRDLAKTLLEVQNFPKDATYRPYDDVAWTLPLLYGVDVEPIAEKSILEKKISRVEAPLRLVGSRPKKRAACYFISATPSQKLVEARLLLDGAEVYAAAAPFQVGKTSYPRGSWIIPAGTNGDRLFELVNRIADSLALDVSAGGSVPKVETRTVNFPRIALFHTWTYTQDSGWVRYTFDRAGIPYTLINKDHLRAGGLRNRFDVILIPNLGGWFEPKDLVHEIDTKWGPMPWTQTEEYPSHGVIDSTPDMTGGMGFEGLSNLEAFIRDGGTLIALGSGGLIPVEMGLVRNVTRKRPPDFHNAGSVVRVRVTALSSPIVSGYDSLATVFRGNLPLFDVPKTYKDWKVLQYGTVLKEDDTEEDDSSSSGPAPDAQEKICVSGYVKGESHLAGKPAILDIPVAEGRVVIFSFNPLHRYLTHTSFGFLYNAILYWDD